MIRSVHAWLAAALAATLGAGLFMAFALPAPAAPAPAAPVAFDCDSPPARVSELEQVQPGPSYRIGGRILARELRVDERWLPVATAGVESADEQDRIMLEVSAPRRPDGPLELSLRAIDGLDNELRRIGEAPLDQPLAFTLVVEGGTARLTVGDMSVEAPADVGPGARVSVGCTTGGFRFEDLRLLGAPPAPRQARAGR